MARDIYDPGTLEMPGVGKAMQMQKSTSVGKVVGYARVSTDDQSLPLQCDALRRAGATKIYEEHASGKNRERPELIKMLKALREGDTLLVCRMDRLGRSVVNLVEIVDELRMRGVGLRSLNEKEFDTTTVNGGAFWGLFALLAEYERRLISERTRAGLDAARARGRSGGRPRVMTPQQVRQARAMLRDPSVSVRDVIQQFKVSRTTLYNYVGAVTTEAKSDVSIRS